MAKDTTKAPATVTEWMEGELERDAALRHEVEETLNQLRIEQDLVELRERHNVSQAELAKALGVTQPVIAKIETGKSKNIGIETLVRIATALGAKIKITIEDDPRRTTTLRRLKKIQQSARPHRLKVARAS